jgi:CBS domain containing-hemolysin-like protein
MTNLIFALILLVLALGGVVVRKTYFALPIRELKRRAMRHEPLASKIYRVAAYGNSLRSLLWLFIGLTSAGSLVLLARELPIWASLLIVGPLLWIAFSLLPASRTTSVGARLTTLVTPLLAWLLNYLHPTLSRGADVVEKRYLTGRHTGLYERDDLLRLIEQQQTQADSRLTPEELDIAHRALSFDHYTVGDVLTPGKEITVVSAADTIGPILIDELHKSDQDYALVRDDAGSDAKFHDDAKTETKSEAKTAAKSKEPFVGTLAVNQLGLHSTGQIRDSMDATVYYLHEHDPLTEALHAFFVTNHPLFVVVNSAEEYVGVLTIANLLRQLLGHLPGDDFDQYTDPTAVASRHVKPSKPEKPLSLDQPKVTKDSDADDNATD